MTSDQFAKLKPPAIISTVASLPRRFGETFVPAPNADPDEVAALVAADGRSMLDYVAEATALVKSIGEAINTTANHDGASVHADAIAESRSNPATASGSRESELQGLEAATDELVATMKGFSAHQWGRTAGVDGGGSVSLEQLGQQVARSAISQLSAAQALASTF